MSQLQPLDPAQFEEVSEAEAMGDTGTQTPTVQPLDSNKFEVLPSYANGGSPLTPVNQSPVGPVDKMLMSLGNKAGNLRYLKSKFEDATENDGDLLIKDAGVWHRVNPHTFDEPDAWEATKNIINKVPGATGTMMNITGMALGGMVGGAASAGAGTVVGAGAGASAAETLRTSLGRLAGTYYATPEQQAKDIGWEGLLGSGGEAITLGVKPALPVLGKALSNIGDTATNFAKENLSSLWGTLTDAGRWATRRAMDDASGVIGKASQAIEAIGPKAARNLAVDFASSKQNALVNVLAEDSKKALQRNYNQELLQLVKNVPDDFSANVGAMMKEVQQNMEAAGYGTIKGNRFVANSIEDIGQQNTGVNSAQWGKILGEKSQAAVQQLARITNQYSQIGSLTGKKGARQLIDLKKALGESFDEFYGENMPGNIQRLTSQIKDSITEKIGQAFADHGVGDSYVKMNKQYATYKDAVDMLNKAVDKGQTDVVVKHLVSKAGSYRTFKDEVGSLATLLGDAGQKTLNDIVDWEASKGFVDFVPKSLAGNSAITTGKIAGTITQLANPRIVAKQIEYGSKALDFIKKLPPKQLKTLLSDDQQFTRFITPLVQSYDGEDHAVQQLLQGSGANPGNN